MMIFTRFAIVVSLFAGCCTATAQPVEKPPHLVTGRSAMPAVALGSAIYVCGGLGNAGDGGTLSDIERIETAGVAPVVSVLQPQILPRFFHGAQAQGNFIYIFGGQARENGVTTISAVVERVDLRDLSVRRMAPLPVGVRTPASVLVGNKIYVAGGSNAAGERMNTLFIYDIAADVWTLGAPLPEAKECELLRVGEQLVALGGFDGAVAVRGVQSYSIKADVWSELPPLPTKTSAHHGAALGQNVVLFGDYDEFDRVQIGDPTLGNWRRLDNLNYTARRHVAALQVGEKIYVIGGNTGSSGPFFNEIQAFDTRLIR